MLTAVQSLRLLVGTWAVLGAREIPPTLGWRGPSRGGRDLCEGGAGG